MKKFYNLGACPLVKSAQLKIIFLISSPKNILWVLKSIVSMKKLFEHQKDMFKLMGKKIFTI